jgi:YfiH family protein
MQFYFSNLAQYHSVQHFVSTRLGGISYGSFKSMNLSFKVGDNIENVQNNRRLIAGKIGAEPQSLFFPDQCHTANIETISLTQVPDLTETDALITAEKNIAIGVMAADCIPILFFDPVKKVIAAAHAGWKGTVQGIAEKVVETMKSQYNSNPSAIIVGIGPGISQKNYEVDEPVISAVNSTIENPTRFYLPSPAKGKFLLDLKELNKQLLLCAGIHDSNIEVMKICTYESAGLFYSARRDGFHTGRFGAIIKLA